MFRREYEPEKTDGELAREQRRADLGEAIKGLRKLLAIQTTHRANGGYENNSLECEGCKGNSICKRQFS
ncbi:MAG: hypothetical protein KKE50_05640 [Nanoarchaeota archaeon]|nr:hypothetical protein [Nanoarchaeota archaeon]